jgi:hypothetical protein
MPITNNKEIVMPYADVDGKKMEAKEKELSKAISDKAHELGVLPKDCEYECHVEVDSSGKAKVVCGVVCS